MGEARGAGGRSGLWGREGSTGVRDGREKGARGLGSEDAWAQGMPSGDRRGARNGRACGGGREMGLSGKKLGI